MKGLAVAAALVLSLAAAAVAQADGPVWSGSVGPGFNISLRDAAGNAVTTATPGPVTIEVDDQSDEHNFHLVGPGVDVGTTIDEIGSKTFQATLVDGVYTFLCDAHPTRMTAKFTAGTGDSGGGAGAGGGGGSGTGGGGGSGAGGAAAKPPSAPVGATLVLTSGPGFAISLKTRAGKRVTRLKPGAYTILARDRSSLHNAHLRGAGIDKKTTIVGMSTRTWKVLLRKGTLVYLCDAHPTSMRGTVTVAPS